MNGSLTIGEGSGPENADTELDDGSGTGPKKPFLAFWDIMSSKVAIVGYMLAYIICLTAWNYQNDFGLNIIFIFGWWLVSFLCIMLLFMFFQSVPFFTNVDFSTEGAFFATMNKRQVAFICFLSVIASTCVASSYTARKGDGATYIINGKVLQPDHSVWVFPFVSQGVLVGKFYELDDESILAATADGQHVKGHILFNGYADTARLKEDPEAWISLNSVKVKLYDELKKSCVEAVGRLSKEELDQPFRLTVELNTIVRERIKDLPIVPSHNEAIIAFGFKAVPTVSQK